MIAKVDQEAATSLSGDGADSSGEMRFQQDGKKPQPNDGSRLETGGGELRVVGGDYFVEGRHTLLELRVDAANQEVAKRGQTTE